MDLFSLIYIVTLTSLGVSFSAAREDWEDWLTAGSIPSHKSIATSNRQKLLAIHATLTSRSLMCLSDPNFGSSCGFAVEPSRI